jgi:4,5-DOPA dioxygenase extradiol
MQQMPVLFVGHGSPMNAVENNTFTQTWECLPRLFPKPVAILSISAHWYTSGTRILDADTPKTVHDIYDFPEELYQIRYPAPGSPQLARILKELLPVEIETDRNWGFDHGSWSVLRRMYPDADIPTVQLSVDRKADFLTQYKIGQALKPLRKEGVLILTSGNVVHNLMRVTWKMQTEGFSWAMEFDDEIEEDILDKDHEAVIHFQEKGDIAKLSVPTTEHFSPLLYALGAAGTEDSVIVFNDGCVLGSLSMTGYLFGI